MKTQMKPKRQTQMKPTRLTQMKPKRQTQMKPTRLTQMKPKRQTQMKPTRAEEEARAEAADEDATEAPRGPQINSKITSP